MNVAKLFTRIVNITGAVGTVALISTQPNNTAPKPPRNEGFDLISNNYESYNCVNIFAGIATVRKVTKAQDWQQHITVKNLQDIVQLEIYGLNGSLKAVHQSESRMHLFHENLSSIAEEKHAEFVKMADDFCSNGTIPEPFAIKITENVDKSGRSMQQITCKKDNADNNAVMAINFEANNLTSITRNGDYYKIIIPTDVPKHIPNMIETCKTGWPAQP